MCEAYLVASVTAHYDKEIVMQAATMTAAIVTGIYMYAKYTKRDFTTLRGCMAAALIGLICFSMFMVMFRMELLHTMLCAFGAVLFTVYLIVDLQLVLGGREWDIGEEDYILAAMILYLDIINLFLYILELMQDKRK